MKRTVKGRTFYKSSTFALIVVTTAHNESRVRLFNSVILCRQQLGLEPIGEV